MFYSFYVDTRLYNSIFCQMCSGTSIRCLSVVHAFNMEIVMKNNGFSLADFNIGKIDEGKYVDRRQSKKVFKIFKNFFLKNQYYKLFFIF